MRKPKATWQDIKSDPERLKYFRKNFAINSIRRAGYRWPGRYNCNNLNKLDRNEYFCSFCGIIGGRKEFQLDHIKPVVDPEIGFEGFDSYIERHLCIEDGFQRLCKPCHKDKSQGENALREKKPRKKLDKVLKT